MTRLSVNVNKVATIRNARGGDVPNLVQIVKDLQVYGAQGITVHPRPDERHITKKDTYDLAQVVSTEYNIEGYPNERFMQFMKDILPAQATLVPDPPGVLTSNAGWDTIQHKSFLKSVVDELKELGIRTSAFIETDARMIRSAAEIGFDRIEFYTGPYAEQFPESPEKAVKPYVEAATVCNEIGLGINAGHDLDLNNLKYFVQNVPQVLEVSIGHALISDALYLGFEKTIEQYLSKLQ